MNSFSKCLWSHCDSFIFLNIYLTIRGTVIGAGYPVVVSETCHPSLSSWNLDSFQGACPGVLDEGDTPYHCVHFHKMLSDPHAH